MTSAEEKKFYKKASENQKVSIGEKIAFGSGDLFGGGAQTIISTVYLVFLVINQVPIALAGVIIMIAKLWDAISDPLMGIISDNTRSKWGRRRPYIIAGGFALFLALFFLFIPMYQIDIIWVKFVTYLLAYMFYNTLSTVIMVPYSSMSTEISVDYDEKTKVNTIRLIFSMLSSGIATVVATTLTESLRDGSLTVWKFTLVMTFVFGLLYGIPLLLAGFFGKERTEILNGKSSFHFKTFLKPLKVKAFVYLLVGYFLAYACTDLITTNVIFFADYGLDFSGSASILLIIIFVCNVLMVPIIYYLMRHGWAKPKLFYVGIPLYIISISFLALYPSNWNEIGIYILSAIIGISMSGTQMMPWIMFPDVVDVAELKLGERPTGSFSGLMTFIRKSTAAIAIALSSFILGLSIVGFKAPETDPLTGIVTNFAQPASAILGLRLTIMIPTVIFLAVAFFFSKKLKLSAERSRKVSEFILLQQDNLLNEENLSPEDWKEYLKIQKELF